LIETAISPAAIGPSAWRRLCLAIFIFAAAAAVSGQPSAADNRSGRAASPDRSFLLRFAAFALPEGSASFVLLEIDGEGRVVERSEPFIVASRNLGAPVSVSRRRLALASASADVPLGAPPSGAFVPIRLHDTGDVFIVLLVPTAEKPGKLEPVVLQADTTAMPPGSIRFFNLGDSRLAWRLGEKTGILPAYGRVSVDPPEREEQQRPAFPVEFYFEEEQSARRFASTTWVYRSAVRSFVFFFPDPETGRYRYRVFEDFPAWTE